MKKSIITIALTGIIFSISFVNAYAQFDARSDKSGNETTAPLKVVSADKVNLKAIKHFQSDYKKVTNAEWTILKDNGFLCRFNIADITYRAFYTSNGQWLYTISSFSGKQVNPSIHNRVQAAYYNYEITFANQIDLPHNKTVYLVEIQDEKSIKKIRVTDEDMEVVQELSK